MVSGLLAFLFAAISSVAQDWSLEEFCWSTWLAGLVYSWVCVVTAAAQGVWSARGGAWRLTRWVPPLARFSPSVLFGAITAGLVLIALLALQLYNMLFGFYGLFLSVYAEMDPLSLFGRNGYINSDFFTPVTYLLLKYWPMTLSTLIAGAPTLMREYPWKRIAAPFGSEVLRMHVMVIALPMLSLLAWSLFADAYERVVIVLLIGIFFLLQRSPRLRRTHAKLPTP